MPDPAQIRAEGEIWRYFHEWAIGKRTEFRLHERPGLLRHVSIVNGSNYEYRHPFLYFWGLWTFVFTFGIVTVPLVPFVPLFAARHAFRTPRYVKVGARAEWVAYRRQRRAAVDEAKRERAAARRL